MSKVQVSQKDIKSGGCRFSRGALYELLANPIYIGEIRHKRSATPGNTKRFFPENSGKESSSGSTEMRRADAENTEQVYCESSSRKAVQRR